MHESFRLGRISGIPIGVNWSILVIFGLIAWGLADVVLPESRPGLPVATYWTAALVTALLFFLCLLAHELSHAVLARRAGLRVEGITLWLFGGVARLGGDARSPEVELRVGAVGPAVSLLLAAGFAVVAALTDALSAPTLLVASAAWLARINLTLGAFNLLPTYPLDGGRVLRAFLWRRHGDQERATVTAARTGEVFAYALIMFGLLDLASGGQRGGLWLAALGWFLHTAARSERVAVLLRQALAGIRVDEAMTPLDLSVPAAPARTQPVITATVDEPIVDVLERMAVEESDGPVLVLSEGRVVGVVSTDDITRVLESAVPRAASHERGR